MMCTVINKSAGVRGFLSTGLLVALAIYGSVGRPNVAAAQENVVEVDESVPTKEVVHPGSIVAEMSLEECAEHAAGIIEGDIEAPDTDDLYMAALLCAESVLPALEERINRTLVKGTSLIRTDYLVLDVIAYATSNQAVDVFARLAERDPKQATRGVWRLLDYARGTGDEYQLAYYAVAEGRHSYVNQAGADWLRKNLRSERDFSQFAEVVLRRYQSTPGRTAASEDPVVSFVFGGQIPVGLQAELDDSPQR